jgi:hypothetical protein
MLDRRRGGEDDCTKPGETMNAPPEEAPAAKPIPGPCCCGDHHDAMVEATWDNGWHHSKCQVCRGEFVNEAQAAHNLTLHHGAAHA